MESRIDTPRRLTLTGACGCGVMGLSPQVIRPLAGIVKAMPSLSCPSTRDGVVASRNEHQAKGCASVWPADAPALNVVRAHGIDDAFAVISAVRTNQSVLLNCSAVEERCAERLITICTGGICALGGLVHRISADVVLFAPALTRLQCS